MPMALSASGLEQYLRRARIPRLLSSSRVAVFEACLIGLVAGASAFALAAGVDIVGALRVHLASTLPARIVLPAFGLLGGLVTGFLVEKFAPEASGSGIPQVKAALLRAKMALDMPTALVKLVSGTIALGSGLFMGREGPTVHVGAALAAQINRLLPTTPERRRQLIAAGAGAGLAAAFNAPMAGVMFVLEELMKDISASTIGTAVLACFVASVVSHLLRASHLIATMQAVALPASFAVRDVPFYVVLGLLAGAGGALFNRGVILFLDLNTKYLKIPLSLRVALAGLVSGFIISLLPPYFYDYAGVRELIIAGDTTWYTVPVAFAAFFFLTILAYGSGAPGGLFAPTLVLGSALGYVVGHLESFCIGTGSPETFALVGMGAFFAAVARVPITAIIIIFEMTMKFELVMPLMIVCIISSNLADRLYKGSIYDRLIDWAGIRPRYSASTKETVSRLLASDVLSKNVKTVGISQTIKEAREAFKDASSVQGLIVLDGSKPAGIITLRDLERATCHNLQEDQSVRHLMTPDPISVAPDEGLENILFLLDHYKVGCLPVVADSVLQGMITRAEVIRVLNQEIEELKTSQSQAEN